MVYGTDYQPIVQMKTETHSPPKIGKEMPALYFCEAVSFCGTAFLFFPNLFSKKETGMMENHEYN
jgi:hypothetical protein